MKYSRMYVGIVLLVVLFTIPFVPSLQKYFSIPNQIITFTNESPITLPNLGKSVQVNTKDNNIQAIDSTHFMAVEPGKSQLTYEVAGVPIKNIDVSVYKDKKLIPGGQSIGVQLHTKGVLVVGHHLVNGENEILSPGEDAKINVGDVILQINGNDIKKMEDIKPHVEEAGKNKEELKLKIKRGKKTMNTTLRPVMDHKEEEYRIGLYIRDSAAGIGTMTFYEPKSKKYGALGHTISDMDTKKPIEIHDGTIVRSSVTSIEKGNSGIPGEKQAKFSIKENKIGTITTISPFGMFAVLDHSLQYGYYDQPMSIALSHAVKEGPAKVLTVVDGEQVEEFDVEIVSSIPQKSPATKGMVVKITDAKLLEKTGGIVQGMSGSPIIQDDKIIGAVTHVFVNDPTSGYGVHIEWMLEEAGVDVYSNQDLAS